MKLTFSAVRNFMNLATEPPEIWSLKRVRNVSRGYKILKSSDDKRLVNRIVEQITEAELTVGRGFFSDWIFPFNDKVNDRAYSQYLLINLIGTRLNASILCSLATNKSIIAPLPVEWIEILKKNGIPVNVFLSRLVFILFVLKKFVFGLMQFSILLIKSLKNIFKNKEPRNSNYVFFYGLIPDCLPPNDVEVRFNIVEWYLNWEGRAAKATTISHDLNFATYSYKNYRISKINPIPVIRSFGLLLSFFCWGIVSAFISIVNLFFGKVRYSVMFSEILLAKCFLYADKSVTAEQYLFNNLNITYRPLWTYSAERKGASVIYFNWAASFSDFLSDEGYKSTDLGEKLMSYTEVLQWSPQYAVYLKSIFSSEWTTVKVVPPIYYSDSGIIPEPSVKPVIVVFDVTPQRRFFHDVIVPFVEYRTVENGRKFLEDLYEVARELGFEIVWKAKRSFTTHHSKEYIKFSNNFVKLPGVIAADPGTSAFRLVQKADFVVSMPFTSTSLIGDVYKVPSAYYDPSLIIKKNDRGANGLALLSGKEELKQWIVKNKKII